MFIIIPYYTPYVNYNLLFKRKKWDFYISLSHIKYIPLFADNNLKRA